VRAGHISYTAKDCCITGSKLADTLIRALH
jgi:hypothetical protein